ncbi:MAG: pyruvate, water dikinase [Thermoleophilia bacterium]|nr:pyruvate, water dikinase [Thermoleophilia bacterium]
MKQNGALSKLKSLIGISDARIDPAAAEEAFRSHYRSFRSLLTANNAALELMAGIEEVLRQGRPFGMSFVRGHSTALSVNVFKMVHSLQELSGGRYASLNDAFSRITAEIDEIIAREPPFPKGDFVLFLDRIGRDDTDLVGDKMSNLGEVSNRVGLNVPPGFVITAAATHRFMRASGLKDEINRLIKTLDIEDLEELYTTSAQIQKLISSAPVPPEIAGAIKEGYRELVKQTGPGVLVSMRSSAVGEDSQSVSFAGQYRTQLNVSEEFILDTYKEIVASKYQSQAIVYRHQRGFRHQDVIMSVGCLAMVDAVCSGVMFSRSPRQWQSPWMEINAAPGLGGPVVAGSARTDFYRVSRDDPNQVLLSETGDREPVLDLEQLRKLARAALRLEDHFGAPQDIEWSIDREGELVILQSRPLAPTAGGSAEPAPAACGETALLSGGLPVQGGAACGDVFVVRTNVDLLEFPKGAVLVVEQPLPEWATLMNRAAAVVSETGHAATHLAIVAREFGVPAVFGMAGAARTLGNGDRVTLDADRGCLYPGRNERVLKRLSQPVNLMANSPVYRLLEEVAERIIPLNLTDPGSPFFAPAHCRTLHDITRFCHEKAVTEMFLFGEKTGFDPKSAKQLSGDMPLRWWVIDLEDGLRPGFDPREKFVFIEDIVSEPMLAIWEGMTAKRWAGPPAVSLKGLGSILFRSTMDPRIDPAVRASMGAKNYFLISKNFCNLSMRLGYHFTLAEAYTGPMLTENYVSFQFRGGAADRSRRFIRVNLLKDILERYGFRVEVILDALTARIERKPKGYLLERLKVLGYLLIHTRQLDMVMGEQDMAWHYRRMIEKDLASIIKESARDN